MVILHLVWLENSFYTWAETAEIEAVETPFHPFALSGEDLSLWLEGILDFPISSEDTTILTGYLPSIQNTPIPSPRLTGLIDIPEGNPSLQACKIPCYPLQFEELLTLFGMTAISPILGDEIYAGEDLLFWLKIYQWCQQLIANQGYYPTIIQKEGQFFAQWNTYFEDTAEEVLAQFSQIMPSAAACLSKDRKEPILPLSTSLRESITYLVDQWLRYHATPIYENDTPPNAQAEWLRALTSRHSELNAASYDIPKLNKQIKTWQYTFLIQNTLPVRLLLQVSEPEGKTNEWPVSFLLQSKQDPSLMIPFAEIWDSPRKIAQLFKLSDAKLTEIVYYLLGSISPILEDLFPLFQEEKPFGILCSSANIYEIFTHRASLLASAGVTVLFPANWTNPQKNLKVVAKVKSFSDSSGFFSLDRLVSFDWKVSIGDHTLTQKELNELIKRKIPLVRIKGQWVILDQNILQNTLDKLMKPNQQGKLKDLLQQSMGGLQKQDTLPIEITFGKGFEVITSILDRSCQDRAISLPNQLDKVLRHYQIKGVAWLWSLKHATLNPCLADDMGLGKTLQILTFLAKEKSEKTVNPSLLICPTAVLENWRQESARFTPSLSLYIHHGTNRLHGAKLTKETQKHDLIITSYALALRDLQDLQKSSWNNLILDEAQNIKNPQSKQTKAIKSLPSQFRVALTGTPIENHVGDLWSLFDFLQPGWLGTADQFQHSFYKPIQTYGNQQQIKTLKQLTDPFILRRVKTDPTIVPDLPEKIESKEYCLLTKEQVTLYESCLAKSMEDIETAEGISRKGKILTLILHLKQICNHPAHYLKESKTFDYHRSGKLKRLWELLTEIILKKEKALLFTQYTEMGELIQPMLQQTISTHTLFYHGGLPRKKRDTILQQFKEDPRFSILILSLKAGGTGLNLMNANHVFHIDRWWNPAVENQATDRAFRIGQKKNVQVHKLICSGTIEEAMDQLLEKKSSIANQIIGTIESLITELSTQELKSLLVLRKESIDEG